MVRRVRRVLSCMVCGCCLQVPGCGSDEVATILATNIKTTAVEIGTLLIESSLNNVLDLEE